MSVSAIKVAVVQMAMDADPAVNWERAAGHLRDAAAQGVRIICLPELFTTPYFCRVQDTRFFDLAETTDGPTIQFMRGMAAELGVVLIVPFFEKRAPGVCHNSAAVIDADGALLGLYRKMHIPQDPGFEEKFYFTPGDLGFRVWNTRHGPVSVLICWDQWFPEAARLSALAGARILFYPTAIGWQAEEKDGLGAAQLNAWQTVQRGHGVANGCFIAAANRVGTEGDTEFWGHSFISDYYGRNLAQADGAAEGCLCVDVDFRGLEEFRRIWPFFRDRRIDSYGELGQRMIDSPGLG